MKTIKRIEAFAMALVMLFSTVVFAGANIQKVSAADGFIVNLHYFREDGDYTSWNVWSWAPNADGKQYTFTEEEKDGKKWGVTSIEVAVGTAQIGYIVRKGEWEAKDYDGDQFLETIDYSAGVVDFYVTSGVPGGITDDSQATKGCVVTSASTQEEDLKTVNVTFNMDPATNETPIDVKSAIAVKDSKGNDIEIADITSEGTKATVTLKDAIDFEKAVMETISYNIIFNDIAYTISLPDYYSSEKFESSYTYEDGDLGATWTSTSTTFKVWAPTAKSVDVNLYKSGTEGTDDLEKTVAMTKGDKGVWSVKEDGDLNGTYYTYTIHFANGTENETNDPYAKAVGVNGNRAMVIDLDSTNPEGWDDDSKFTTGISSYADASIWEIHVRDFSYSPDSGVSTANRGKYLAFTEKGTKNSTGQPTCLDYLKQLGVTHVQINPAYDYATVDETKLDKDQFNWGYDPKNYNVPEGSYSSDPYNGAVRIKEYKEMVQSLHNEGIGVIMDVVYNHTYNTEYCFNKIVPGYFYRGSNASGCGNDVASERAMVSKFIVESVLYWHNEYHIDGFRFDLVGLIDVDTINELTEKLHAIDPSIILYGEGWTMDSTKPTKDNVKMANQGNAGITPGFAYFNDAVRDSLKGSVFNADDKGYVNGMIGKAGDIYNCVIAAPSWNGFDSSPQQMINYSSCHDNLTLWDKINSSNGSDTFDAKVKQNNLAAAITFTSQGVPFILAGEEILRTKVKSISEDGVYEYDHNSYASSSKENCIKWDTLNIEKYQNVLEYYKGLIAFRNAHPALRMADGNDINSCITQIDTKYLNKYEAGSYIPYEGGVLEYAISGYLNESDMVVIYNPNVSSVNVNLPDGVWDVYVQGNKAGNEVLNTVTGKVKVDGISATVLVKGDVVDVTKTAKVSGISASKTYTGKAITMSSIKVSNNGKTLKKGTDYTVAYSSNKNAGTAKVKITFKGLYKGTITKTFKIAKASQTIKVTTSVSKKASAKAFALNAKLSAGNGKLSYKSSNTKIAKVSSKGKVTLTGKKGTVKITVTAASTTNYNKATKTVTVKVK